MAKPPPNPKTLAIRKRLLQDFEFYAKHAVKIRTKSEGIQPLVLNRVQKRFVKRVADQLETTGKVRFVVLKGRQQGLSTCISAYIYWRISQHKGEKATVLAHIKDSSQALFEMYHRCHKEMPEMLRPSTRFSSKRELVFDQLDSGVSVTTAGGDSPLRGETLQHMHLSEVAFWPANFAKQNFSGLIKALPNNSGSCFAESTANGMQGSFHELWQGAVNGTNGFEPFFSAWFESDEYRETPPKSFERTPDEEALAQEHGLDDAQLYWRRREIARDGLDQFHQEYPCTADEAFITSGLPVFNPEVIVEMKSKAPLPLRRMAVEQTAKGWRVEEHSRGELSVYREREPNGQYWIGADVSVGIKNPDKADFCVAQVLDAQKRQVATWRGQPNPDHFARILYELGLHYNVALVAPERNGHGLLVCVRLWKDLSYPNCFFDLKEGEIADKETLAIGFQTNVGSRPLVIDKLRGAVRERDIEIYDQTTLSELQSFIATESGKMEAEQGCYDDCVMALAIANHIHEGKWVPLEVSDDFYAVAI